MEIMKTSLTAIIVLAFCFNTHAQIDFIGKSRLAIVEHFSADPLYQIKIDSLSKGTLLITIKYNERQYPFYTYEVDTKKDRCSSFGLVSKNRDVLDAYLDILDKTGLIIQNDPEKKMIVYRVGIGNVCRYYSINRPYWNDKNKNKRELFYILVSNVFSF